MVAWWVGVVLGDQGSRATGGLNGAGRGKVEKGRVEDRWALGVGKKMGKLRKRLFLDRY